MGSEDPANHREPRERKVYAVASSAGEAFDAAVLGYVLKWIRESGHALSREVAARTDLMPGRGSALVVEGTPLITRSPGREHAEWDFISRTDGSPPPREGSGPISLAGRVRWFRSRIWKPDGTWAFVADPRFPDPAWRLMVRRFLAADPQRIVLAESTFNTEGKSSSPDHLEIVVYHGQVMHLLRSRSTDEEIERAWEASQGWGGGEKIGLLTSLTADQHLSSGDELSDELLRDLSSRTQGIGLQAFDGEGVLVWGIGAESRSWFDEEG